MREFLVFLYIFSVISPLPGQYPRGEGNVPPDMSRLGALPLLPPPFGRHFLYITYNLEQPQIVSVSFFIDI